MTTSRGYPSTGRVLGKVSARRVTADPAERDPAEDKYRIDRKRIEDDRDRAIESIRGAARWKKREDHRDIDPHTHARVDLTWGAGQTVEQITTAG